MNAMEIVEREPIVCAWLLARPDCLSQLALSEVLTAVRTGHHLDV